jgi:hypothetical protein
MKNIKFELTKVCNRAWVITKEVFDDNKDGLDLTMSDLEWSLGLGINDGHAELEFLNLVFQEASGVELSTEIYKVFDVSDLIHVELLKDLYEEG